MNTVLLVRPCTRSLTFCVSSSADTSCESKNTLPSLCTATIKASSLSASCRGTGLLVLAISTETPFCSIGVITMKMISSTSITSTMGVTLFLEFTLSPSLRMFMAFGLPPGLVPHHGGPFQEVVKQFAGCVVHLHVKSLNFAGEIVKHHDCWNGHAQ